jgi:hypothetical protein
VRTLERVRAARESAAASEFQVEIERNATGDVRRPIGTIEPPGEVETSHLDRTGPMRAWHGRVEYEGADDAAPVGLQVQIGREPAEWTSQGDVE